MSDSGKLPPRAVAIDGSCFQCTEYFMRSCLVEQRQKEAPHSNYLSSFSIVQESSWHLYMQKFMFSDEVWFQTAITILQSQCLMLCPVETIRPGDKARGVEDNYIFHECVLLLVHYLHPFLLRLLDLRASIVRKWVNPCDSKHIVTARRV